MSSGDRFMNFLWYTNETTERLKDIMTDADGHRHRYIVPAGKVKRGIWKALQVRGAQTLSKPHLEVFKSIDAPFIQAISDFVAQKAAFEDGRVLLVGDAVSRPLSGRKPLISCELSVISGSCDVPPSRCRCGTMH